MRFLENTTKNLTNDLVNISKNLADVYSNNHSLEYRKSKGQIFTPREISKFMVNLLNLNQRSIKVLDCGAGTGILSAALLDRIINERNDKKIKIIFHAYENDPPLIKLLKKFFQVAQKELIKRGHKFEFKIFEEDFIVKNANLINNSRKNIPTYDIIISNPPYYKFNKDDLRPPLLHEFNFGQPNIYSYFMIIAIKMISKNGEMVFITPRSFCSGLYYKKIRRWIIDKSSIDYIHIFKSRTKIFDDDILQENMIIKTSKRNKKNENIVVSYSSDRTFSDIKSFIVKPEEIFYHKNGDIFIRIPSSREHLKVFNFIDKLPTHLIDIGIKISTGPVVPFRKKRYIKKQFNGNGDVPLIWMHNLKDMRIEWPNNNTRKEEAILVSERTKNILIPVGNYVLVSRFFSKENERVINSSIFLGSNFNKFNFVGIENHVNYIYKENGDLTKDEVYGISAILNSAIFNSYFKTFIGSTQINVNDLKNLPFPPIEIIRKIGKSIQLKNPTIGPELDKLVNHHFETNNIKISIIGQNNNER